MIFFYISTRAFAKCSWAHVSLSERIRVPFGRSKQSKSSVNKSRRHLQNFDYILLMYTSSSHMISLKKPFIFVRSVQSSFFHFSFFCKFCLLFYYFQRIFFPLFFCVFFYSSSIFAYAKCQRKHSSLLFVFVFFIFFPQSLSLFTLIDRHRMDAPPYLLV